MKKKLWKKPTILEMDVGFCRYCKKNILSTNSFVAFLSVDEDGQRVIPDAIKEEKVPQVVIEGDKQESEFEKGMGGLDVKQVESVRKDSNTALDQNTQLDIIKELTAELETGKFGTSLLELSKLGQRFGVDTNWLSQYDTGEGLDKTIANAEVLQVLSSQFVLDAIGKTKGSISDKEMAFFQSIAPNLSMSPEGIKRVVEITKRINDRKIQKSSLLDEWVSDGSIPSRKKMVEGVDGKSKMMTFNQMWNEYVNTKDDKGNLVNPLFTKDETDELFNLSKTVNLDEGVNIRILNGNKYYELPDGNFMFLGKV